MAYYLSKQNRDYILSILPLLQPQKDVLIPTPNPDRLAYILRNAANSEEFQWLKHKFIFRIKSDGVLCKFKAPLITEEKVEIKQETLDAPDFFKLITNLISNRPSYLKILIYNINEDDLSKVQTWCSNNDYELILQDKILELKDKNA